jgi:hypothetical protein
VTDRPAGTDLVFLSGQVVGADTTGVRVATGDGTELLLTVPSDHAMLPYRENLALLGNAIGAELRVVGRPDPSRPQCVHPLALSTVDLTVNLGFDRLPGKDFPAATAAAEPAPPASSQARCGDLALHLVRRHAERVVAGGRAVQALAAPDEHRLRAARLDTGAGLVRALTTAAQTRPRDPFGRPVETEVTDFAEAWLAVAVYEQAASWALSEASWLPGRPGQADST